MVHLPFSRWVAERIDSMDVLAVAGAGAFVELARLAPYRNSEETTFSALSDHVLPFKVNVVAHHRLHPRSKHKNPSAWAMVLSKISNSLCHLLHGGETVGHRTCGEDA